MDSLASAVLEEEDEEDASGFFLPHGFHLEEAPIGSVVLAAGMVDDDNNDDDDDDDDKSAASVTDALEGCAVASDGPLELMSLADALTPPLVVLEATFMSGFLACGVRFGTDRSFVAAGGKMIGVGFASVASATGWTAAATGEEGGGGGTTFSKGVTDFAGTGEETREAVVAVELAVVLARLLWLATASVTFFPAAAAALVAGGSIMGVLRLLTVVSKGGAAFLERRCLEGAFSSLSSSCPPPPEGLGTWLVMVVMVVVVPGLVFLTFFVSWTTLF